ncbi:MAG: archaellin/type IV pilin N-terminal domain-containing protein [archaeon]|nr:archaellin/type IV pilin N-terminal domain-containing protein [archaeon]
MVRKNNVSKKGVTPVIAIVLLLMMTVAAAGLAYEFIMNMSQQQTEAIGEQVGAQSEKMRTDLRILQVQEGTGSLDFLIKNVGSVDIGKITAATMDIKVDGEIIVVADTDVTGTCVSDDMTVGGTCKLTITAAEMSLPSNVGITKTFEFILENGYVLAYGCNIVRTTDTFC